MQIPRDLTGFLTLLAAVWIGTAVAFASAVRVDSDPPGAEVEIFGARIGCTPLALRAAPGKIRVVLGGCEAEARVEAGSVLAFRFQQGEGGAWSVLPPETRKEEGFFLEYANIGGGALGNRVGRLRGLERGVGPAMDLALAWLARHQDEDGRWSVKEFAKHCGANPCSGPGSTESYDVGVTALAAMAFLRSGHTATLGAHCPTVRKALAFLAGSQDRDGIFGGPTPEGHHVYGHAIATIALLEAAEMDAAPGLRQAAQRGIDFLVKARCPKRGGWRYGVRTGESDTSMTSWAMRALVLGRYLGYEVPFDAVRGGLLWYQRVTEPSNGRVGYTSKGDTGARLTEAMGKFAPAESCTAAAMAVQLLLGRERETAFFDAAAAVLEASPPRSQPEFYDLYYWYGAIEALHRLGDVGRPRKDRKALWDSWRRETVSILLSAQRPATGSLKGDAEGSWEPVSAWAPAGGRVYTTAMAALILLEPGAFPAWPEGLPEERTFFPDFRGNLEEGGEIGYTDEDAGSKTPGGGVGQIGANRILFKVICLEMERDRSEPGGMTYHYAEFLVEHPSRAILKTVRKKLKVEEFMRMKKADVHRSIDLGGLGGFVPEAEKRFLYDLGLTTSPASGKYKGKLPAK